MRLIAAFAALLIAVPAFAGDEKYNSKVTIGQKAPSFEGIPACSPDEKECTLSLADIKEDVVVLVFLGNHCPVVGFYEDRMIDFAKKYEGKSVKMIGVSVNNNDEDRLPAIKDRMKEKGYNFSYGYDATAAIGRAYGANKTPEFFVLDKDRTIRYAGAMDDNNDPSKVTKNPLADAVNALLAGESVEVSTTTARGCGIQYPPKQ